MPRPDGVVLGSLMRSGFTALTVSPATARSMICARSCCGDLARRVERRADDLLHHVVAERRRFGHVLLHGRLRSAGALGVSLGKTLWLGNLPNFWDGFRRPVALGFRVLLLMKRLQSRGVGFAKRRAQFAAMQVLLDLDRRADGSILALQAGAVPDWPAIELTKPRGFFAGARWRQAGRAPS
jgi:hypothetical protein